MKVGVISDIHDNIWKLEEVLKKLKYVEELIFCGDFCAPFVVKQLDDFGKTVHAVFGNTDDRFLTTKIGQPMKYLRLYGDVAEFELDGRKIAVNHFPVIAEGLASTGKYDAVFYGHTHRKDERKIGNCLLVNPGEIMGRFGLRTYVVYDTTENSVECFELE